MLARHRQTLVRFAAGLLLAVSACATAERIPLGENGLAGDSAGGVTGSGGESIAAGGAQTGGSTGAGGSGGSDASGGSGGTRSAVSGGAGGARAGSGGGSSGSDDDAGPNGNGGAGTGGRTSSTGGATGGTAGTTANQLLFADDFEGSPKNWVSAPAEGWSVVSDDTKVYRQGTLDTELRVSAAGNAAWTDQVVEARVKVLAFTGSSTSYFAGVFARFKDVDNHYFVALQSDGHVKIKKKSGGSTSSISSQADPTVMPGAWYTIKLAVKGATLTAYLDGAQVLTATDPDISNGGIALGTKNATAEFDDVKVTTP